MESVSKVDEESRDADPNQVSNSSDSAPMPLHYLFDKRKDDMDAIPQDREKQSSFDENIRRDLKTLEAHRSSTNIPIRAADIADRAPLPLQFLFDSKAKKSIDSAGLELSHAFEGPAAPVCMQDFSGDIVKEKMPRYTSPVTLSRRTGDSLPSPEPLAEINENRVDRSRSIPSTDESADFMGPNYYPVEATLVSDTPDAFVIPIQTTLSSQNPVYDAVLVPGNEQRPWLKRHQRFMLAGIGSFVSIIIIVLVTVMAILFSSNSSSDVNASENKTMATPFDSSSGTNQSILDSIPPNDNTVMETETIENANENNDNIVESSQNSDNTIQPTPYDTTNLNVSSLPKESDNQNPGTCDSSIEPEGYLFESHCGVCDPIIDANGATLVATKRGESIEFFALEGNNFELVSSIDIDCDVSDVTIVGAFAAIGAAHIAPSGSVFIFEQNVEGLWSEAAFEVPQNVSHGAMFGTSLVIGKNDDYFIQDQSKVEKKNQTGILEEERILQQDGELDVVVEELGGSVGPDQKNFTKISGEVYIVVGAPYDRPTSMGTSNTVYGAMGSASIFRRNATANMWQLETTVRSFDANSIAFGSSVSAMGDSIAVADPYYGFGRNRGAVFTYLYNSSSSSWENYQVITNEDCNRGFGSTVVLTDSGGMIVGCRHANSTSLYHYKHHESAGGFVFSQKIKLSGNGSFELGNGVAVDGKVMAVGSTNVTMYTEVENKWRAVAEISPPPLSQDFGKKPALLRNIVLVPSSSNVHRYSFSTGRCLGLEGRLEVEVLQRSAAFGDMDANDPRKIALNWILNEDGMNLRADSENLNQRFVLTLLAFSLNFEAWNHSKIDMLTGSEYLYSEWLTDTDECTWFGVMCSEGVIMAVELGDFSLIGTLPPEIGMLGNLEVLDMSSNCLFGTIPSEFGLLSNLMYLDFNDNGLSGYIPDSFFDLKSLVRLDLSYNVNYDSNCTGSNGEIFEIPISFGIEGTILEDKIENLRYLMDIDLTDNYFSGTITSKISALKNLERLVVDNNVFKSTIPNEITKLENIRELGLSTNYFTGKIPDDIGNLKSLEIFSLWGNENLTGSLPESLYDLAHLEDLHLFMNTFTGTISSKIGQLTKLKSLALAENKFNGTLPSALGLCENLEFLRIESTDIGGTVPQEVCSLTSKNLFSEDRDSEYFKADCLPNNVTLVGFIECDCCSSCCDHDTNVCILLGDCLEEDVGCRHLVAVGSNLLAK